MRNILSSIKRKIIGIISEQFRIKFINSYAFLKRLHLYYESKCQLKYSKTLLIFSIYIATITTISETTFLHSLYKLISTNAVFDKPEFIVRNYLIFTLNLVGFIGSMYLVLRRKLGLWLVGVWASLSIIPIFISFQSNGHISSQNYLNYFNLSPFVNFVFTKSVSFLSSGEQSLFFLLEHVVKLKPFTSGVGFNLIPLFYLLIVIYLLYINRKKFSVKARSALIASLVIFTLTPFATYYSIKYVEENKRLTVVHEKLIKFMSMDMAVFNQKTWEEKCEVMATIYFNDKNGSCIDEIIFLSSNKELKFKNK